MTMPPTVRPTSTRIDRIKAWGVLVVWMAVVLLLSSDAFNASHTGGWFLWFASLIGLATDSETFGLIHTLVRKSAHFFEYAILGAFAVRACNRQWTQWTARSVFGFAFALASVWACVDELHQSQLPSRTGSPLDVALDSLGGASGAAGSLRKWNTAARAKKNRG